MAAAGEQLLDDDVPMSIPRKDVRWVAVVVSGEEGTFIARAERLKGATMVAEETCAHKHKTGVLARDCARKLVERLTL
jgi:hypothetical protein